MKSEEQHLKPIKIIFDANSMASTNKTGVGYLENMLITNLAKYYPKDLILVGYYYDFMNRKKPKLPILPNIIYKPIVFYPFELTNLLRRLRINIPMEILAKSRSDLGLFLNFLSQPSLFGKPTIPYIHDLSHLYYPAYAAKKSRRDLERFIPKTLKRATAVLTNSEFTKSTIVKEFGYPPEKILVTHIPPEAPDLNAINNVNSVKQKFKIYKPYILFVGTLEPRKNLENLLEAYGQSSYLNSNYSLVIAGGIDWKYTDTLKKIEELKDNGLDVVQTGYVKDAERNALYAGTAVFVLPSHFEGFGMPILEAFSYDVPVCASDIPVFKEVAGDAAVYFDKDDPASISAALESVLKNNNLANDMVDAGQKRLKLYNWQDISKEVFKLIKTVVEDDI